MSNQEDCGCGKPLKITDSKRKSVGVKKIKKLNK